MAKQPQQTGSRVLASLLQDDATLESELRRTLVSASAKGTGDAH